VSFAGGGGGRLIRILSLATYQLRLSLTAAPNAQRRILKRTQDGGCADPPARSAQSGDPKFVNAYVAFG